jgi:glycosyltransferase 2 family protein
MVRTACPPSDAEASESGRFHALRGSVCIEPTMPDPSRRSLRRWPILAVKLLIVALVVYFIRRTIVGAWKELENHSLHVDYAWLAAAGGFYLLGTLFCGVFWHRILRAMGQEVGFWRSLRAFYLGHLGKYVPGKAMVVILRAGMIRGPGVDAPLAIVSVFLETLTMMAVGALMAAGIVAVWCRGQPLLFWGSIGMMAVAGLPTLPPVFRIVVRIVNLGRLDSALLQKLDSLGYGTIMLGWALNVIGWTILGLSYWATLRALGAADDHPLDQLHLYTAAVALATVLGFISLVPSGAVVREAALSQATKLMLPGVGDTIALVAAVLLRLVWLAAELAVLGLISLRRLKRRAPQE